MITAILTELVDLINSCSYTVPLTAVQRWAPETEKGDTSTVCFVWCSDMSLNKEDRCGISSFDVSVKVGIRKPVNIGSVSDVNQVAETSEEVAAHVLSGDLPSGQVVSSADWISPIELDELYEDSVAISVFELKIKGIR